MYPYHIGEETERPKCAGIESATVRWGGRAAECTGFENLHDGNVIASSNLAPTAFGPMILALSAFASLKSQQNRGEVGIRRDFGEINPLNFALVYSTKERNIIIIYG